MKYRYLVAALLCTAACQRATVAGHTPVQHQEIHTASGQTILAGHTALSELRGPVCSSWFIPSYEAYNADGLLVKELGHLLKHKRMDIFLGSWCGDSRREVPRMVRLLKDAGMDTSRIALIFVDNRKETYKQSPQHEEQGRDIRRVPTFILYDSRNRELGRIVESPKVSLEADMVSILRK